MSNYNQKTISTIKSALSHARLSTFEKAVNIKGNNDPAAIKLYLWNALLSGSLLMPLHICEIVIRNAVAEALEQAYGKRWPWSATFERSLPDPERGYSARSALRYARRTAATTEKVIPELSFVFWQNMFTRRYNTNLWDKYLYRILPNIDRHQPATEHCFKIHHELVQVRKLRNRIAHHEPIFSRNVIDEYNNIITLIKCRCHATALCVHQHQTVVTALANKPEAIKKEAMGNNTIKFNYAYQYAQYHLQNKRHRQA